MTFSLKTLFTIVTLAALSLGFYLAFGPAFVAIVLVAFLVFAGFLSHKAKMPAPWWQCVASIAILFFLLPPLGHQLGYDDAVISSIFIAIGAFLAYSSIRHGHWSTRLLGIVVIIPYILGIGMIVFNAFSNWPQVVEFWSG